jgi:hypothetical protein
MLAIDCKIRVERQHGMAIVNFGHSHDERRPETSACRDIFDATCVGQKHAPRHEMQWTERRLRGARRGHPAPLGSVGADASSLLIRAHRQARAPLALGFAQRPSDDIALLDPEMRLAVPYQRLRRASRPKLARCLEFEPRSEMPESTVPRTRFINRARLARGCWSEDASTSRKPSSTISLSFLPRNAASALARR